MEEPSLSQAIRALRRRYGPQDASIKLSEVLFFLGALQDAPRAADRAPEQEKNNNPIGKTLGARGDAKRPSNAPIKEGQLAHVTGRVGQLAQPLYQLQV